MLGVEEEDSVDRSGERVQLGWQRVTVWRSVHGDIGRKSYSYDFIVIVLHPRPEYLDLMLGTHIMIIQLHYCYVVCVCVCVLHGSLVKNRQSMHWSFLDAHRWVC